MATRVRVHRPLKVVEFYANGIGKQRFDFSKQLQHRRTDGPSLRDTSKTS
jgi:hypothetical protein